jgi:folate-binding protein YgfZ
MPALCRGNPGPTERLASGVTSPLLRRPGAVPADAPDAGVAAHYGDPYREQRRLAAGLAEVDLSHRPVVRIAGPDRLSWLHSLTSQALEQLVPGERTETLVLSPHGHVEHDLQLVDDGTAVLAHVEPGTAEALIAWLDRMRFMLRVEVSDATPEWAVLGTADSWRLVPRAELEQVGELAGVAAYEALRVEALRPRLGRDVDARTIPNETRWLSSAVHLAKGCYRGQETVARVDNLGRPPRRLALLHLDGSDSTLPATGEPVLLGTREVGRVGTAVRHHELGPIALALVKRQVPDDADLLAGTVPARLEPESAPPPPRRTRPELMRF